MRKATTVCQKQTYDPKISNFFFCAENLQVESTEAACYGNYSKMFALHQSQRGCVLGLHKEYTPGRNLDANLLHSLEEMRECKANLTPYRRHCEVLFIMRYRQGLPPHFPCTVETSTVLACAVIADGSTYDLGC
jgi:hypothetical protein